MYNIQLTKKEQQTIEKIEQHGVKYLKRLTTGQTLNVCRKAIQIDPNGLRYILNQTKELIFEAIQKDYRTIKYIAPAFRHEAFYLELIEINPKIVTRLESPTKKMWELAVQKDLSLFKYFQEVDEEVTLAAIKMYPDYIYYVTNPTDEMQLIAVRHNGNLLNKITNPSLEIQLEAIRSNGQAIEFVKNPTREMMEVAVNNNPFAIWDIPNCPHDLILEAIRTAPSVYEFLEEPTKEMTDLAIQLDPKNILFVYEPTIKQIISAVQADYSLAKELVEKFSFSDYTLEEIDETTGHHFPSIYICEPRLFRKHFENNHERQLWLINDLLFGFKFNEETDFEFVLDVLPDYLKFSAPLRNAYLECLAGVDIKNFPKKEMSYRQHRQLVQSNKHYRLFSPYHALELIEEYKYSKTPLF